MIQITGLSHIYPGSRKMPPRTALHQLDLAVPKGEFVILSGPNGSGKSSLFRILCGLAVPSKGQVTMGGFDVLRQPSQVRRLLGVVFQNPAVDKQLSVGENLRLHADLYGISGKAFESARDQALAWTDLKDRLGQKVETLSGGLARQVELAKVLMTDPQIVLLDEPTTGLDPSSRRNFLTALHQIQKQRGLTVLMTSHIFSEADHVDRVAILSQGHLLAYDRPAALKALIGTEMVVAVSTDALRLAECLRTDLGLSVHCHGDEVRLEESENGEGLPLLEKLLADYRSLITSVSIKQPDLDDVFVHVTGRAAEKAA